MQLRKLEPPKTRKIRLVSVAKPRISFLLQGLGWDESRHLTVGQVEMSNRLEPQAIREEAKSLSKRMTSERALTDKQRAEFYCSLALLQ